MLNAYKTEILALHTDSILKYEVTYNSVRLNIPTFSELKICGIWYSSSAEREYHLNISQKIEKLTHRIKLWKPRNLTFEGRSLIIKTFGLSQLIYGLQIYQLKESCIKELRE